MGSKRNSISYNSGKLPVYNDASAAVGGEISIASSLSNQLLINELNGNGILFRTSGTNRVRISPDDHLQFTASSGVGTVAPDTSDGADNKLLTLAGGGTGATSRGGYISIYGNEASGHPASIVAVLGSTTGSFKIVGNNGANLRFEFTNDGNLNWLGNSASGGDFLIRAATSDGADNGRLRLCGGGTNGTNRGSSITISGNENASLGGIYMESGNSVSASSGIIQNIGATANNFELQFTGTTALTIGSALWSANPQTRPSGNQTAYTFGPSAGRVYPNITTSGTNNNKVLELFGNDAPISVSATDSGYRIGLAVHNFFDQSTFAGTLSNNTGAWIRAGTNSVNPTGTITTVIGLQVEILKGANTTFGTTYGIYQNSAAAGTVNYFQNAIGIGTNNPGANMLAVGGSIQHQGDIQYTQTTSNIWANTSDGSDTKGITINGGGAFSVARGASIGLWGNENGTYPGHLQLYPGVGGDIQIYYGGSPTLGWRILGTDGTIRPNADNAVAIGLSGARLSALYANAVRPTYIQFNSASNGDIYQSTSDAADTNRTRIGGGGDVATTRGGFIELLGNESTQYDGAGGGQIVLRAGNLATGYIRFETGGSNRWQIDGTNGYLLGMASEKLIGTNTTSGSDNARLIITGSGGIDGLRGATISLYGNNNSGAEGLLNISSGSNATNSAIVLNTQGSEKWRIKPNGDLQFALAAGQIFANTADAADTSGLYICGGGGQGLTRGAQVAMFGNEASGQTGNLYLDTGNATAANVYLRAMGTTGSVIIGTNGGTQRVTVLSDGTLNHKTHANYAGSGTDRLTAAINTTDATTTNLYTETLADNTTYKFTVDIIGRFNSTTAKGVWGKLEFGVYRNNAGGATLAGTRLKIIDTYGASGYDFDVDVTSNDVRVRVTGATSETVSWSADIKSIAVSTAS